MCMHTSEAAPIIPNNARHHSSTALREIIVVRFSAGGRMREHDVITTIISRYTSSCIML